MRFSACRAATCFITTVSRNGFCEVETWHGLAALVNAGSFMGNEQFCMGNIRICITEQQDVYVYNQIMSEWFNSIELKEDLFGGTK